MYFTTTKLISVSFDVRTHVKCSGLDFAVKYVLKVY